MELHSGSDRHVFIGKSHTIKIARSSPFRFMQSMFETGTHYGIGTVVRHWRAMSADNEKSLKWFLLHGVAANKREARIAQCASEVATPTRALLAGLVAVQPTTSSISVTHRDILRSFCDHLDEPGVNVARLGHSLEKAENFGLHEGVLKFRDAGSLGLERVLIDEGGPETIQQALGSLAAKAVSTRS